MSSQVIALKYRPTSFSDLIGQEMVSNTLSLALDTNKLSHAYLFSGLRGSGKTSTARIFAKSMLCENKPTSKPCEVCDNCKYARVNKHPDIIELDAASHRGIDDIRDLIEQSKYTPSVGRYKIFIIDEAHMITIQAFNAFLKTLEEPNETTKFILATTDPLKIPPTILSRTQHFRFKKIAQKEIVNRVIYILSKENVEYENEALETLARSGQGSMRDTLTLLEQAIIYSKNNITTTSVVEMLGLIDPKAIDDIFNLILKKDLEGIKEQIKQLDSFELETIIDEFSIYLQDRLFNSDDRFNTILIDRFFRILSDSKHLLFMNSSNIFVLTLMMFKFIEALNLKDINTIINELEGQSKDYMPQVQTNLQNMPKKIEQSSVKESVSIKEEIVSTNESVLASDKEKFQVLLTQLNDKSLEVGQCFQNGITFLSFENDILKLQNNITNEECKKLLRLGSAQIRTLVKDVFGISVQIEFIQTQQPKEEIIPKEENIEISNIHQHNKQNIHIEEQSKEEEQPKKEEIIPKEENIGTSNENIKDLEIIQQTSDLFGIGLDEMNIKE
jgi:DNA polymerase-3 subunit gamma/tau